MASKQVSAQLPPDLADHIEDYHEQDDDTSQADAVRHYLRKGVQYDQQPTTQGIDPAKFALDVARVILAGAIIIGVAGLATGIFTPAAVVVTTGLLALIGSSVVVVANRGRLPCITIARTGTHEKTGRDVQ